MPLALSGPLTSFPGRCLAWHWTAPPSSLSRGKSSDPSKERVAVRPQDTDKSAMLAFWDSQGWLYTYRNLRSVKSFPSHCFIWSSWYSWEEGQGRCHHPHWIDEEAKAQRSKGICCKSLCWLEKPGSQISFYNMMLVTGNTGFRKACLTTRVTSVTTPVRAELCPHQNSRLPTLHFQCRGYRFDPYQGTKIPRAMWYRQKKIHIYSKPQNVTLLGTESLQM